MIFFLFGYDKIEKNENLVYLTVLNHGVKKCGRFHM